MLSQYSHAYHHQILQHLSGSFVSSIKSQLYIRPFSLQKMRQFQKTLEDLSSRVASAETTTSTWTAPNSANEATEQMQHLQRLRDKMTTACALLDDCNEQQGFFTANHVLVPTPCLSKLEDLNTR